MTAKPSAQRVAESDARKREAGLKRVWLWAHPDDVPAIRALGEKLSKRRRLRTPPAAR